MQTLCQILVIINLLVNFFLMIYRSYEDGPKGQTGFPGALGAVFILVLSLVVLYGAGTFTVNPT